MQETRKVESWPDFIKAIRENVPVVETIDRCISPNCFFDFLSPNGMIDEFYLELQGALRDSKTHTIIGEYSCKASEEIAEKFGKIYLGRRKGYVGHSLEEESTSESF